MRLTTLAIGVTGLALVAGSASGQTVYGITRDNRLLSFNPATPGTLNTDVAISGLAVGETALGIDVRPLTGEIFVFGSTNRMYSVTPAGAATGVGAGFTALATTVTSFDFNPTVDRVRVVDALANNRRLNPVTGGDAATDTALTYSAGGSTPRASGVAYTNAQFGANVPLGSTREMFVDSALDVLGEVGSMAGGNASFNGGVCTQIGALGFNLSDDAGFDIFGPTGALYLSDLTTGGANFYTVNIGTGAASLVGLIGTGNRLVTDIATIPAPGAGAAAVIGLAMVGRRRRA